MQDEPRDLFAEYIDRELDLSPLGWTLNQEQRQQMAEMEQDFAIVREVPADLLVEDLDAHDIWLIGKLRQITDIDLRILMCIATLKLFFGYGGQDAVV